MTGRLVLSFVVAVVGVGLAPHDAADRIDSGSVVHQCPIAGSGLMPCCGLTPFDVLRHDRISVDSRLVTCDGPPS